MSSKRLLGVGAAAACALILGSTTAAADSAPQPRDQLRTFVCQKALDPPARAVSVQAVMRPVTSTARMQMRFELMRQTKNRPRFMDVHGRGLGSWISPSNPTLGQRAADVWIVNHPVVDLSGPATYKYRVTFRWLDADGQTLSTQAQTSPTCFQPELRADLLVKSLSMTSITTGPNSGKTAYTAMIENRGLSGAGPVEVDFSAGTSAPQTATVAFVGSKSSVSQRFVAAPCTPGSTLTVTVDPTQSIDEYDFANNALTMTCPAASSG